eukprot:55701-Eustigmatos_ZCMA.PRE.1
MPPLPCPLSVMSNVPPKLVPSRDQTTFKPCGMGVVSVIPPLNVFVVMSPDEVRDVNVVAPADSVPSVVLPVTTSVLPTDSLP